MSGTPQNKQIGTFLRASRAQKRGRRQLSPEQDLQIPVQQPIIPAEVLNIPLPDQNPPVQHQIEMATPHIKIQSFSGRTGENGVIWLEKYSSQCKNLYNYTEDQIKNTFPYFLTGQAEAWYYSLPADIRNDPAAMMEEFKIRFDGRDQPFSYDAIRQRPHDNISEYTTRFLQATNHRNMPVEWLVSSYIDGLRRDVKLIVKPQQLATLEEGRRAAVRAEQSLDFAEVSTVATSERSEIKALTDAVRMLLFHGQQPASPAPAQPRPQPENTRKQQGRNSFPKYANHLCKLCSQVGHFEQNCPDLSRLRGLLDAERAQSNTQ